MMAAQADRQELRHCRMRSWFRGGLGTWHTASKSVSSRRAANMKVSTGICIDPGIPPALSENSLADTDIPRCIGMVGGPKTGLYVEFPLKRIEKN